LVFNTVGVKFLILYHSLNRFIIKIMWGEDMVLHPLKKICFETDTSKEEVENEYDIEIANEAYAEYIESGKQSKPIEKLWKELDI